MSEKVKEESSQLVTSNKHINHSAQRSEDADLMGYKGGAARGVTLPGAGRPDGPGDDGGSGGPTVGGPWAGLQADGTQGAGFDEITVVDELGKRVLGNILDT